MRQEARLFGYGGFLLVSFLVIVVFSGLAPAAAQDPLPTARSSKIAVPSNLQHSVSGFYWEVVEETRELLRGAPAAADNNDEFLIETFVARVNNAGEIQSYIYPTEWDNTLVRDLEQLGVTVELTNEEFGIIQAWVPVDLVEQVATMPGVRKLDLPSYGSPRTGQVVSAGDALLKADSVRSELGYTGKGIKIGVISDGVDNRADSQATGDLPATINMHPTMPGSDDEGTAMLEIIHDLAPDAELYFCGPGTSAEMVECMNWFVAQGCHVAVDDLGYYGEPYFADGLIAQGAANVVQQGLVYVSACGNDNKKHYQGNFNPSTVNTGYHNFGTDDVLEIEASDDFRVILQWSDPMQASANDYDLKLLQQVGDSWEIVESSEFIQDGDDNPFEYVFYNTSGIYGVGIEKRTSAQPRELELFLLGSAYITDQDRVDGDAIFGHPAVESVISVGAINADDPSTIAYYSSHGPSTIYTDFTLQTRVERQSLDGAGIAGVETKTGQLGYFSNPFYGTSASAPHIAAVAALMLEANPALTPAQVSQALQNTATDMGTVGYDTTYGAGLFDAYAAVNNVTGNTNVPTAPTNLTATAAISESEIVLFWQDNSDDEISFVIERSPGGTSSFSPITTTSANATSYTDSGLQCETIYYYRVKATGIGSDSSYSNNAFATTASCGGSGDGNEGDCNADGKVNAADLPATVLRIAGKDFFTNEGCNSNSSDSVDSSDLVCTVLLIFGETCGSGIANSSALDGEGPFLALPESLAVSESGSVGVPIVLEGSSSTDLSGLSFSLVYDQENLRFDPSDTDNDGVPDSVVLSIPDAFSGSVIVNENEEDGNKGTTISVVVADVAPPLSTLDDGTIATVTFQVVDPAVSVDASMVGLAASPPTSFSNSRGQQVPPATPQRTESLYLPLVRN